LFSKEPEFRRGFSPSQVASIPQGKEIKKSRKNRLDASPPREIVKKRREEVFLRMTMHTQTVTNSERKQTMVRSRLGLKALGLCALLLGLMAFASSAAQAEPGSTWSVLNLKTPTPELFLIPGANDLLPQLGIELENSTAELLFTTKSGTKVAILCTSAKFDEGGLLQASGGISLGRILFKGCLTKLNGVLAGGCKPSGGGTEAKSGEILSEKGKGLITLDEVKLTVEGKEVIDKEDYIRIIPEKENAKKETETSKLFSKIELGPECAIGESVNVEAKTLGDGLWIKDCPVGKQTSKERALEYNAAHLIEQALGGEASTLLALGQPATIDGSALARLTDEAHLGFPFRGTWN
jgi:hypothetical protein